MKDNTAINLCYPRAAKKTLPVGKTIISIKNLSVRFPDVEPEKIYSPVAVKFCRSVSIFVDKDVAIDISFEGSIVHSAVFFPSWTRIPNVKFDRIEINTTADTKFYFEASTAPDGVPSHVA